eukprot:1136861-Pelagomonas_calceolata.AAC.9
MVIWMVPGGPSSFALASNVAGHSSGGFSYGTLSDVSHISPQEGTRSSAGSMLGVPRVGFAAAWRLQAGSMRPTAPQTFLTCAGRT